MYRLNPLGYKASKLLLECLLKTSQWKCPFTVNPFLTQHWINNKNMDEKAKVSNTLVTHNQHLLQQLRIFQKVFPNTMQDHLHITMPSNCSPGKKVFVVGCNCRCYFCTVIWKVVFSLNEEKKNLLVGLECFRCYCHRHTRYVYNYSKCPLSRK